MLSIVHLSVVCHILNCLRLPDLVTYDYPKAIFENGFSVTVDVGSVRLDLLDGLLGFSEALGVSGDLGQSELEHLLS